MGRAMENVAKVPSVEPLVASLSCSLEDWGSWEGVVLSEARDRRVAVQKTGREPHLAVVTAAARLSIVADTQQ